MVLLYYIKCFMKKLIYHAVGTTHLIQEKIKELLEDLIQNQHYTEEEGKRIIDDFFGDIKSNIENVKFSMEVKLDELFKKLNIDSFTTFKNNINQVIKDIEDNPYLPTIINHKK